MPTPKTPHSQDPENCPLFLQSLLLQSLLPGYRPWPWGQCLAPSWRLPSSPMPVYPNQPRTPAGEPSLLSLEVFSVPGGVGPSQECGLQGMFWGQLAPCRKVG